MRENECSCPIDPAAASHREAVSLDARLAAAAALVQPGARVADVGCDHGKLSVHLAQTGRAVRVIAVDVRPGPLEKAKQLIEKTGCGPLVECRLADGLSSVLPDEVDTVVLAGISGITACEILEAAAWTQRVGMQIVAVPANKPEVLRRWLAEHGFQIEYEHAALAAGRPYTALSARWDGRIRQPSALWCRLGLLEKVQEPAAEAYRRKILHQLERQLNGESEGGRYTLQELEELRTLRDEVRARCR